MRAIRFSPTHTAIYCIFQVHFSIFVICAMYTIVHELTCHTGCFLPSGFLRFSLSFRRKSDRRVVRSEVLRRSDFTGIFSSFSVTPRGAFACVFRSLLPLFGRWITGTFQACFSVFFYSSQVCFCAIFGCSPPGILRVDFKLYSQ